MGQERTLELTLTAVDFDGTGIVTKDNWTPKGSQQAKLLRRTNTGVTGAPAVPLGRFPPTTLGFTTKDYALLKIWSNAPIGEEDRVEIRSSLTPADGIATDVLRDTYELTNSFADAPPIIISVNDDVCVFQELDDEGGGGTVHICVIELDEAQLFEWWKAQFEASQELENSCCDTETIEISDADIVEGVAKLGPFSAHTLFVLATFEDTGQVIELPDSGDLEIGSRVFVSRRDFGPPSYFRVQGAAGDTIDGEFSPDGPDFIGPGGVLFELVEGPGTNRSWNSTALNLDLTPVSVNAGDAIDRYAGHAMRNVIGATGDVTLPPTSLIAGGQVLVLTNKVRGEIGVLLADPVEENFDGVLGGSTTMTNLQDTIVAIPDGVGGWRTADNMFGLAHLMIEETTTALAFSSGWRGRRAVIATNAMATTVTLPPSASTPIGCQLLVMGTQAAPSVEVAGGSDRISGAGAAVGTSVTLADNLLWGFFELIGPLPSTGQAHWAYITGF